MSNKGEGKKQFVYYLPDLDLLAEAESNQRITFVIFIHSLNDWVPFDAVLLGEL